MIGVKYIKIDGIEIDNNILNQLHISLEKHKENEDNEGSNLRKSFDRRPGR